MNDSHTEHVVLLENLPNGVAVITFNRPQNLNALTFIAMRQFADHVNALTTQTTLRAVIITGAGTSAFCSGGDLFELANYPTEEDARSFINVMGDALLTLERLQVPVIAAINGYALGGGSEIAVACDMRIVDEKARMGFLQIRLALTPGWGAGQRLLRMIGYARAMDVLLHGHVMHAPEIEHLGLANKVVEAGKALDYALNFAQHITEHAPEVVQSIKRLLQAGLHRPYDEALTIERDLFPPLWAAPPHLHAVEDFLKRNAERKQAE